MIITLTQADIESALVDYVQSYMGKTIKNATIDITAGRGQNGFTANVDIDFERNSTSVPTQPIQRKSETFDDVESSSVEEKPTTVSKKEGTLSELVSNPEEGKPKASIWGE